MARKRKEPADPPSGNAPNAGAYKVTTSSSLVDSPPPATEPVTMQMPEISSAQLVAIVGAILGVVVSAGLDLSEDLQNAIIQLVSILAPILVVGDAVIRHGRSKIAAARVNQGAE